jgi:hypothetical protein
MFSGITPQVTESFWIGAVVYFWVLIMWLFTKVFADLFRRDDITGAGKAG